jgi:hypothetical protein
MVKKRETNFVVFLVMRSIICNCCMSILRNFYIGFYLNVEIADFL